MKTVSAFCLLVACLALFSGCSSDPTSDDFKEFAEGYAQRLTQKRTRENGDEIDVVAKLEKVDLRKTDSVTFPFQGIATFKIEAKGVNFYHPQIPEHKGTATFHSKADVVFNWDKSDFQPFSGTLQVLKVDPAITDKELLEKIKWSLGVCEPFAISEAKLNSASFAGFNGFADPITQ
jgi:hypothetical protein